MNRDYEIRSVTDLLLQLDQGYRPRYFPFWGHQPEKDGSVGKGCLSQWFHAPFTVDGDAFPTAEHFMMAGKARLFGDEEARLQVLASPSPAAAKQVGRSVRNFDEARWNAARFDIVVRGNVAKFGQNSAMRDYLLATGERVLVEASPRDRIWGIGMGAANPEAEQPRKWRGQNLLGFALMAARAQLRAGL
ncbi:NADAR family protein [Comamonas resistens]|uniref:NADAR family protein n=1 Tax=Comamonas resistens TaxID=3046670 RepID=A0ABY8SZI7_9BURK|nr:NADAR family protein [Comamonas resistens]MDL5037989.1 NADAR family protein [Comamonas resistens]WHS67324.1 NADAR family protein [Comamonas resistens]